MSPCEDLQGGRRGDPELTAMGPWFHNLHLPDGRQTAPDHPLGDFPTVLWRDLAPWLPEDLGGTSVLDIGCNAGFYALELAQRGAEVLAIDSDEHYLRQARWAAARFGLADRIRFERRSVYRLHEIAETFDLVLFLGVLYHLRYPLLALDLVRERTRGRLLLQSLRLPGEETATAPDDMPIEALPALLQPGWPRLAFVENALAGDRTNWWIPDRAALEAMLRSSGFTDLQQVHRTAWLCRVDDGAGELASARREALRAATGASPDRPCPTR